MAHLYSASMSASCRTIACGFVRSTCPPSPHEKQVTVVRVTLRAFHSSQQRMLAYLRLVFPCCCQRCVGRWLPMAEIGVSGVRGGDMDYAMRAGGDRTDLGPAALTVLVIAGEFGQFSALPTLEAPQNAAHEFGHDPKRTAGEHFPDVPCRSASLRRTRSPLAQRLSNAPARSPSR